MGCSERHERASRGERKEKVPSRRYVEGVNDLHPGEQAGERDLDRAQLADVSRGDDLEDERGEDAEHRHGEQDLDPLPRSRTGRVGEPHAGYGPCRGENGADDRYFAHRGTGEDAGEDGDCGRDPESDGMFRRERGVRAPDHLDKTNVRAAFRALLALHTLLNGRPPARRSARPPRVRRHADLPSAHPKRPLSGQGVARLKGGRPRG